MGESGGMQIANPIYDVAFKYLLDDNGAAKIFLSALIGEKIEELTVQPTEGRADLSEHCITVFRLDFCAKIRCGDGSWKLVLLEVQKAKFPDDILRFRRYLGTQYADKANTYYDEDGTLRAMPILTVYFLGHSLEKIEEPVVWIERGYYGLGGDRKKRIEGAREDFVEGVTHDGIVVQVPYLKGRRRTEVERLLEVFDQSQKWDKEGHLLDVDEMGYPEEFRAVIRRLIRAGSEKEVREAMEMEDTLLESLAEIERAKDRKLQEAQERAEQLQKEKAEIEESAAQLQKEKTRSEEKAERLRKEKEEALQSALVVLVAAGIEETEARKRLGL